MEASLQRLFSTFANGWPGKGLFLQRLVTAVALLYCVVAHLRATQFALILPQLIGAGAGMLLLVGLWTPVAGTVVAGSQLWVILSKNSDPWMAILLAILGGSLAMIGPGAWSIDARLFGRKRIETLPR